MRRQYVCETYTDIVRQKEKRRIAWLIEQERERQHERLKRKKIEEYEKKRAQQLMMEYEQRSSIDNSKKRKIRSKSEESHKRCLRSEDNKQYTSNKHYSSNGIKNNFNGPEIAQRIDPDELRTVKITIRRNIVEPTTKITSSQSDGNNFEIILNRREGEGMTPIFDRDELKTPEEEINEIKEYRTIELNRKINIDTKLNSESRSTTQRCPSDCSPSSNSRRRRSTSSSPSEYKNFDSHDRKSSYSSTFQSRCNSVTRISRSRNHKSKREFDDYKSRDELRENENQESKKKDYPYERRDRRKSCLYHRSSSYLESIPFPHHYWAFIPRPMLTRTTIPPIRRPIMFGPQILPIIRGPLHINHIPPYSRKV